MQQRLAPWVLGMLLAPAAAWAGDAQNDTVKPEDVKTWTATIDGKEYEVRPATPTDDGDTGLFRLSSAYTLPKGKASFSLYRDNFDRDPKDLDFSIHGLSIGYGASDKFEIFGSAGLQNRLRTAERGQSGFFNDLPFAGVNAENPHWQQGFGDIKVGAKYKFLDDYRSDDVGLAVKAYVKLGTADEAKGLGTGKTSFGADLILSKSLSRQADIHASIGYLINSDPDALAGGGKVDIGDAFKWGVGLVVPACRNFQLQAELTGLSYGTADYDQTNPIDLVAGPVIYFKPGIFIRPAFSWALNFDARTAGSGMVTKTGKLLSIGYHPGTPCCAIAVPPPPPPPPSNRPPTVTVTCESPVLPGVASKCHASASDPDGDPLTYAWSSGGGKVAGSGADANLDTTGITPGNCVPVSVKVDDGRGGTADATTQVCVKAPERKEAQTLCTSSGFPRNLERLNNVDKACLDDVASRLRQDPRARLVVIGHADSKERYPEVIARKRAEAIKSYLVKERGVDETRITAKSAGATKPIDTGASVAARAKNRRVEVILVPEGASAPEDDD
jgi:outer membrane protein OmpA-like peptidoglycan-associated protein